MSADPRSNEDIIADAARTEVSAWVDAGQAVQLSRIVLWESVAARVIEALSAAGRHIVSEGEGVWTGKRGRITKGGKYGRPPDFTFVPSESVSPGTDRP